MILAELEQMTTNVPTSVEIETTDEGTTASNDITKGCLASPSHAQIRLDRQEQQLFQLILETADAYANGKIELTTSAPKQNNEDKVENMGGPIPSSNANDCHKSSWTRAAHGRT